MSGNKEIIRAAQGLITDEDIPTSPPDDPDHLFWLEQGRKALMDSVSLTTVRAAATSLMTGLGAMQAVYIGVLGFAEFITKDMKLQSKWLFALPSILWLASIYFCLRVLKTEGMEIRLTAPNEIRNRFQKLMRSKQRDLNIAFWLLLAGLVAATLLLIWRRLI